MYKVLVGEYIDDEAIARLQKARDVKVDVKSGNFTGRNFGNNS